MGKHVVMALLFWFWLVPMAYGAVGDAVAACLSVVASGTLDIRPGSGIEWIIHNVSSAENWQLKRTDGTDTQDIAPVYTGGTQKAFRATHLTNNNWLQIVNQNGAAASVMCYDGIVVK